MAFVDLDFDSGFLDSTDCARFLLKTQKAIVSKNIHTLSLSKLSDKFEKSLLCAINPTEVDQS